MGKKRKSRRVNANISRKLNTENGNNEITRIALNPYVQQPVEEDHTPIPMPVPFSGSADDDEREAMGGESEGKPSSNDPAPAGTDDTEPLSIPIPVNDPSSPRISEIEPTQPIPAPQVAKSDKDSSSLFEQALDEWSRSQPTNPGKPPGKSKEWFESISTPPAPPVFSKENVLKENNSNLPVPSRPTLRGIVANPILPGVPPVGSDMPGETTAIIDPRRVEESFMRKIPSPPPITADRSSGLLEPVKDEDQKKEEPKGKHRKIWALSTAASFLVLFIVVVIVMSLAPKTPINTSLGGWKNRAIAACVENLKTMGVEISDPVGECAKLEELEK